MTTMIEEYTKGLQYYTSDDGLKLAYRDEGEGMPLVMIGGINRNGIDYKYLVPHLNDVRQIRVDLRGRGASDYGPWETYLTHQEALDVVKLLDVLGIEKAAFIGTSRGGALAMELASFAKDRLIGVCLNDIGAGLPAPAAGGQRSALGQIPEARTYAQGAANRAKALTGWYNVPEGRWEDEIQILYHQTPNGLALTFDIGLKKAAEARFAAGNVWDLWAWFEACDGLPLALIRGENSEVVSRDIVAKMQAHRPDMIYADVPGRGHSPWLDEPEALAAIHQWLAACRD